MLRRDCAIANVPEFVLQGSTTGGPLLRIERVRRADGHVDGEAIPESR